MYAAESEQKILIAWHHNTFPHAEAVIQVAKEIQTKGGCPIIFDLTHLLPTHGFSISQFFFRKFDRLHRFSSNHALLTEANQMEVPVINPRKYKRISLILRTIQLQNQVKGTAKDLEQETRWGGLGPALASDVVTRIAFDEFAKVSRYPISVFRSIRSFLINEQLTNEIIKYCSIDSVVVFNGRLCAHAGVWKAARSTDVDIEFYEVGIAPFFFLEKFRPHDRKLIQEKSKAQFRSLTKEEIDETTQQFRSRRSEISVNRFLELQLPFSQSLVQNNSKSLLAIIFTSSPEELIGVGATWENPGWQNQYAAIRATAKRLDRLGYEVVIRIHPNIANKSWREFNRAMKAFRDLPYSVLLPYDLVNSYSLLDKASIVVVWRSTVGLEASALGKPTYCLNPTRYDETADIRRILTIEELESETFEEFIVDSTKSKPAIFWSNSLGFCRRRELSDSWTFQKENFYQARRYMQRFSSLFVVVDNLIDIANRPTKLFGILRKFLGNRAVEKLIRYVYGYQSNMHK